LPASLPDVVWVLKAEDAGQNDRVCYFFQVDWMNAGEKEKKQRPPRMPRYSQWPLLPVKLLPKKQMQYRL